MGVHGLSLFLDDSQIFFGSFGAVCIALLQTFTFEVLRKDFFLEDFGDSQLPSSFHFEAFELFYLVIETENYVSFFEELGGVLLDVELGGFLFLFCCWNHHSFVGTVDFEENGHLFSGTVLPLLTVLEPLILVI